MSKNKKKLLNSVSQNTQATKTESISHAKALNEKTKQNDFAFIQNVVLVLAVAVSAMIVLAYTVFSKQ
ncbi:MAG: hypothetical protein LBS39_01760 [Campylobacteraceae bacterium]|nr:hypothetical protein [Campylobacteraceae bacterium]